MQIQDIVVYLFGIAEEIEEVVLFIEEEGRDVGVDGWFGTVEGGVLAEGGVFGIGGEYLFEGRGELRFWDCCFGGAWF